MPTGPDVLVLLPEFYGPFRVAFQVPLGWMVVQSGQGKHLVLDPEHQGGRVERKILRGSRLGQAMVADLFDVHEYLIPGPI